MDGLTFIAELTKALAWPTAAVVAVVLLRGPVGKLIPLLRSLRYGDLEIDFEQGLAEASRIADEVGLPAKAEQERMLEPVGGLVHLATISPHTSILESWRHVENSLVEAGRAKSIDVAPAVWTMPLVLSAMMLDKGALTQSQHDLLLQLKLLRDRLVHTPGFKVPPDEAIRYAELASRLRTSIAARGD
jgi:hypothetical protein